MATFMNSETTKEVQALIANARLVRWRTGRGKWEAFEGVQSQLAYTVGLTPEERLRLEKKIIEESGV